METKYYVDSDGIYIGGYAGKHGVDLTDYTEVTIPPPKLHLKWQAGEEGEEGDYVMDNLTLYKKARFDEVDIKDEELIALGFSHDNGNGIKQFPLNEDNQIDLYKGILPVTFPTIDGMDEETFTTEAELTSFFTSELSAKMAHKEAGRVFKISIRNASDKADVDAIIDNR